MWGHVDKCMCFKKTIHKSVLAGLRAYMLLLSVILYIIYVLVLVLCMLCMIL